MTRQCKDCVFDSKNKLREIIKDVISCVNNEHTRLEAENAKLKEKYQEELTVNNQLREWQDEDLRQIAELKKDLDLFRKAHDNEQAQRRILEQKLEKIKEIAKTYRENCKIEGNCLDKRLCSTCYFGGGLEVCDDILDIIEGG